MMNIKRQDINNNLEWQSPIRGHVYYIVPLTNLNLVKGLISVKEFHTKKYIFSAFEPFTTETFKLFNLKQSGDIT